MIYSNNEIANRIIQGDPVILPTETVYGVGVRYDNQNSIDKLFEIKNRNINKPITIHMTKSMLSKFKIPKSIHILCERIFPGPFSLIIESKKAYGFHSKSQYTGKIGIRIPENKIFQEILNIAKIPLCMTSANISNHKSTNKFHEIKLDIPGIEDDKNVSGQESMIIDTTMQIIR